MRHTPVVLSKQTSDGHYVETEKVKSFGDSVWLSMPAIGCCSNRLIQCVGGNRGYGLCSMLYIACCGAHGQVLVGAWMGERWAAWWMGGPDGCGK